MEPQDTLILQRPSSDISVPYETLVNTSETLTRICESDMRTKDLVSILPQETKEHLLACLSA